MFVYIFLGFYLTFEGKLITSHFDVFFDADANTRLLSYSSVGAIHYIARWHPLYLLFSYPPVFIIKGFVLDVRLAVIIFQSLLGAGINCFMFKILSMLGADKNLTVVLTLIYGFSFSALVFSAVPETYIISSFLMLWFWYYIISLLKSNPNKLNFLHIFCLIFFAIGSCGVIFVNFIPFLCGLFYLLSSVYKKNIRAIFIDVIKILIGMIFLFVVGMLLFKLACPRTPYFFKFKDFTKLVNLFWGIIVPVHSLFIQYFITPLTSLAWTVWKNISFRTCFNYNDIRFLIAVPVLYLTTISAFILNFKKICHTKLCCIFIGLICLNFLYIVHFNSAFPFLFSQNYCYVIVLLLGIIFGCCSQKLKKLFYPVLWCFLAYEVLVNFFVLYNVRKYLILLDSRIRYSPLVYLVFTALTVLIIFLIYFISRKFITSDIKCLNFEKKNFLIVGLYMFLCVISMVFISFCWWRL